MLKKTKFAPGIFSAEELDRKWEGYDKEKVVCGFMKQTGRSEPVLQQMHMACRGRTQQTKTSGSSWQMYWAL